MNNLPKVVAQQRRGRASNLDRKSDALPLSHRATHVCSDLEANIGEILCYILLEDVHGVYGCGPVTI